ELAADNRVLGRFQLGDIRPAPRGEPQVEVTFDVDANGILNVTARDKDTGKEQGITISEGSNLDAKEVERMISEAEAHRNEDVQNRERIDTLNELDAVAYRVERTVNELGDAVPAHDKARAELLIGQAREAVSNQAEVSAARELISELQQLQAALTAAASSAATAGAGASGQQPGASSDAEDEDIVDADFDRG
ncbi:MAG: molecular chaperone DnaK, partial [Actinomycetota bacterium]|nr:molecular chaperone DnaK [Actinomycetota bacterium]